MMTTMIRTIMSRSTKTGAILVHDEAMLEQRALRKDTKAFFGKSWYLMFLESGGCPWMTRPRWQRFVLDVCIAYPRKPEIPFTIDMNFNVSGSLRYFMSIMLRLRLHMSQPH